MKNKIAVLCAASAFIIGGALTACAPTKDKKPSVPSHTHSYVDNTVEPTCTDGGYTVHTCDCGDSYTDNERAALGHDYTDWVITADGHGRECNRCDGVWSGEHTLVDGQCSDCEWTPPKNATVIFELADDETYYSVTGAEADGSVVVIPATYEGIPVKAISAEAFKDSDITAVVIPNGIESIGANAFAGTTALKNVVIPDSIATWGNEAFAGSAVKSVTIECAQVGASAFYGYESLETVVFTDKLTQINNLAFYACEALKNVQIPQSGVTICYAAFGYTSALETVEIPAGTKWNGSFAFWHSGVKEVTLHCGVGGGAFEGCASLETVDIDLPEGSTGVIGAQAFNDSGLASITISSGITEIKQLAFAKCKNLKTIVIPDTVTKIGTTTISKSDRGVFMESGLTEIVIPDSVETMNDQQAFENCTNLKPIHIGKNCNAKSFGLYRFSDMLKGCNALETITVSDGHPHYYAENNCLIYKRYSSSLTLDKMGKNVTEIPSECVRIGSNAFYGNTELTSFTVPEGITQIENNAFYGCANLSSISLPNTLTMLDNNAFQNCGLTQITLPASLKGIGVECFKDCAKLNAVTFANPNGWSALTPGTGTSGGETLTLDNSARNAEYLKAEYCDKTWRRA